MSARKKKTPPGPTQPGKNGGTLKKGHGPGNPFLRKQREFREEVESAIDPKMCVMVLRGLAKRALMDGDNAAAKVFLDRVMGKARTALSLRELYPEQCWSDTSGEFIELPVIQSPQDAVEAVRVLREAFQLGRIDIERMRELRKTVEIELVAIQAIEGERRMTEIEDAIDHRTDGDAP